MKKIIEFKKEISFRTNVFEITSISLEHNLIVKDNNLISGNFIINGEYKMSENSINTEIFEFSIPCDINLDEKYILDKVQIDIDDFYYEVINSNLLQVNIGVSLDKIEEHEVYLNEIKIKETSLEELEANLEREIEDNMEDNIEIKKESENNIEIKNDIVQEERCIENEDVIDPKSIFDNFNTETEEYSSYKVYIVREMDTIESIIDKYGISKETLEQYNDIREINLGDKLIIPDLTNEKN